MKNPLAGYLLIAIVAIFLLLMIMQEFAPRPAPQPEPPIIQYSDPVLGGDFTAPVQLVAFGAYGCPGCASLQEALLTAAGRFGSQLSITWKDVLAPDATAQDVEAAQSARCAQQQGFFWQFHQELFSLYGSINLSSLLTLADTLQLDREAFQRCLETGATAALVEEDTQEAEEQQLTSLPTFYINGTRFVGVPEITGFLAYIESLLQ